MKEDVNKVVIYSVGLLGASLGLALRQSGFTGSIVGVSSTGGVAEAVSVGAIDYGVSYGEAEKEIENADMLFLCSPISIIVETIKKVASFNLPKGLIISDVGSTKAEIVEVANTCLPRDVTFVGGHPMAGSEKSGPSAGDPFLFQNAVWVLTESKTADADKVSAFGDFLNKHTGCRPTFLDPLKHDAIAATVSHVPHLIAVALVNLATSVEEEVPGALSLAAGGFHSLTRIASSPYGMWHDIYSSNRQQTDRLLASYIDILEEMRSALHSNSLESFFNSAAETRRGLKNNRKGFQGPLYQIVVVAKDVPGFLSKMTGVIADADLNIADLELLKVRSGDAGTFMIAFGSESDADKAIEVLQLNGFTVRSF